MPFSSGASLLVLAALPAAYALTGMMRRYALSRGLIDRPNERSSHVEPTPRGGGMAIAIVFLCGLALLSHNFPARTSIGLIVGGAAIALIGFIDDHVQVPPVWRLLAHFTCAAWILFFLDADLARSGSIATAMLATVAAVYLVWTLNLYNFMDGIDGLAAAEAVALGVGGAVIGLASGAPSDSAIVLLPMLLAAAAAGFLFWNFPPARIFMGDGGSGFLGLMFGSLSLSAALVETAMLWAWLVLLGVFVVDATITLARRGLAGERLFSAHRKHAYQHAARQLGSHRRVTVAVSIVNVAWLLPWAVAIAHGDVPGPAALLVAYAPLTFMAFRFRAGLD